jgi:hypothetical protein
VEQNVIEQIDALLDGEPLRWALNKLGLSASEVLQGTKEEQFRALRRCWSSFTVTRQEIDELVRVRGYTPGKWCRRLVADDDGWYFVPQDGWFYFFFQVDGAADHYAKFRSEEEAMPFLINWIIGAKKFPNLMAPAGVGWVDAAGWTPRRG